MGWKNAPFLQLKTKKVKYFANVSYVRRGLVDSLAFVFAFSDSSSTNKSKTVCIANYRLKRPILFDFRWRNTNCKTNIRETLSLAIYNLKYKCICNAKQF